MARYHKSVMRMEKGLVPNKVVPMLRDSVQLWREFVPVVQYLCNKDMHDRHWTKINDLTRLRLLRGEGLTLKVLMDHQVRTRGEGEEG